LWLNASFWKFKAEGEGKAIWNTPYGYNSAMVRILRIMACLLAFIWVIPVWGVGFSLRIDDMLSSSFSARKINADLDVDMSHFEARIGELAIQKKTWRNVRLACPAMDWQPNQVRCAHGILYLDGKVPLSFSYNTVNKSLDLQLSPAPKEIWHLSGIFGKPAARLKLVVENGQASRLATFIPADVPKPSAGTLSGTLEWEGLHAAVDLRMTGVVFSDASGLHAGEKFAGALHVDGVQKDKQWNWQANLDWRQGEIFWQPLYFAKGGHQLQANGSLDDDTLRVVAGTLTLAEIGTAQFSGVWERKSNRLAEFDLHGNDLKLADLYTVLIKPFLDKTALAQVQASGRGDIAWRYVNGETEQFALRLRSASFTDANQRFALQGVEADIPWQRSKPAQANIRIASGSLYKLPLGAVQIPLKMNGLNFDISQVEMPLLDGKLSIEDFHAEKQADGWQWNFGGGLTPVSMEQFTKALGTTPMHGSLSGIIPRVNYARENLTVDGALLFKIFNGTAVVKGLSLTEPFGPAPRLLADIDMSRLDLELLTQTFSFGKMLGLIDVEVHGLELSNWKPVVFDARVASSSGDYPRKISQTAVQNISALGGAGAAAAIQRSFLSFFEQFGYSKLGLSCKLLNGVCLMGGVVDAPQGYVIVQGGGIPAISVMGYNRHVNWQELLDRLARITQSNVKPIVQ
jgi:hypothetical protein